MRCGSPDDVSDAPSGSHCTITVVAPHLPLAQQGRGRNLKAYDHLACGDGLDTCTDSQGTIPKSTAPINSFDCVILQVGYRRLANETREEARRAELRNHGADVDISVGAIRSRRCPSRQTAVFVSRYRRFACASSFPPPCLCHMRRSGVQAPSDASADGTLSVTFHGDSAIGSRIATVFSILALPGSSFG